LTDGKPLGFADGIRLLAKLRDKGINTSSNKIRADILHAVAENRAALVQFCPPHLRRLFRAKGRRDLVLQNLTIEVNQAWGQPLDPLLPRSLTILRKMHLWSRITHILDTSPTTSAEIRKLISAKSRAKVDLKQGSKVIIGLLRGMGTRQEKANLVKKIASRVGCGLKGSQLHLDLQREIPNLIWRGRGWGGWKAITTKLLVSRSSRASVERLLNRRSRARVERLNRRNRKDPEPQPEPTRAKVETLNSRGQKDTEPHPELHPGPPLAKVGGSKKDSKQPEEWSTCEIARTIAAKIPSPEEAKRIPSEATF